MSRSTSSIREGGRQTCLRAVPSVEDHNFCSMSPEGAIESIGQAVNNQDELPVLPQSSLLFHWVHSASVNSDITESTLSSRSSSFSEIEAADFNEAAAKELEALGFYFVQAAMSCKESHGSDSDVSQFHPQANSVLVQPLELGSFLATRPRSFESDMETILRNNRTQKNLPCTREKKSLSNKRLFRNSRQCR